VYFDRADREQEKFPMSKSQRLRHIDLKNIYRLIGDCRDLGADPIAWRRRLLEGVLQLTGARVAYVVGLHGFPGPDLRPAEMIQLGLEESRQTKLFAEHFEFMFRGGEDSLLTAFMSLPADRLNTRNHIDMINIDQWQQSESYQRFHRAMDMEPGVLSMCPVQIQGVRSHHTLTARRSLGERPFSQRDVRLVDCLHHELAPDIGRHLAAADEPSASQLSPRMQETLRFLLDGMSEKQIADRLGISRTTVHEYVTALYRRFGVSSRAELMARWIRYGMGTVS
jgi:DNA-binding CsgD family transcriptional regulator